MITLKISLLLFTCLSSLASGQQEGDDFYETFVNRNGTLVKQLVNLTEGYIPRRAPNSTEEERIVGGADTMPADYPFFAFVRCAMLKAVYCKLFLN